MRKRKGDNTPKMVVIKRMRERERKFKKSPKNKTDTNFEYI